MSTYKVPVTKILDIQPHNNAHSLSIATVYGFQVIVQKDKYKVGDTVVYVPIDSILPQWLEDKIFPPGSKVTLSKHRVRQIRLRKIASQGMLLNLEDISDKLGSYSLEDDVSEKLEITKYEPPCRDKEPSGPIKRNRPKENQYFHKYGGLDNIKWFPTMFQDGEEVVVQEKIHGSNVRFGLAPFDASSLWKKLLKFLRLAPTHEWVYGSNNVQLQHRYRYKGFYGENVYGLVLQAGNAKDKLKPGEIVYGEVYGDGIQKNYNYGCTYGQFKLIIFDVKIQTTDSTKWLNPDEVNAFAKERGFDVVPELYRGPFSMEKMKELTVGDSVLCSQQKVREGVVVRGPVELETGRRVLKVISEAYLDDTSNTDFH